MRKGSKLQHSCKTFDLCFLTMSVPSGKETTTQTNNQPANNQEAKEKRKEKRREKKSVKGAIAQLVVRRADNAKVPGSKPGSTNFFISPLIFFTP